MVKSSTQTAKRIDNSKNIHVEENQEAAESPPLREAKQDDGDRPDLKGPRKESSGALDTLTKTQKQKQEVPGNLGMQHKNLIDVEAAYQIPSGTVSPRFQDNPKKTKNAYFEDGPHEEAVPSAGFHNAPLSGHHSSISVSYRDYNFKAENPYNS